MVESLVGRRAHLRVVAAVLFLVSGLKAQPARIVSTFPSITETVFALGAGGRVVGVSQFCRYPPSVISLPKVGSYTKPDPEKIALLRPDLVIIQKTATSLAERLTALGIKHVDVGVGSLAEVYSMIGEIGQAVGASEQADKLKASIRVRLTAFQSENKGKPHATVLIVMGRTPGTLTNLVAVGPGAYVSELLEIAGGKNVLRDTPIAYPHISLETVLRLNPDVVLDASLMGSNAADPAAFEARLRQPWLEHRELAAVQNGRVFGLTSEPLVTPGPRIIEAVQLLRDKIWGQERPR
jgi:iron complex transport system substrate-binding protein